MIIPQSLIRNAARLEEYYKQHYPALAPLVKQCFLNTIETTVTELPDGSIFVITGDIPAMWLRDSAAQVRPYVRFAGEDPQLQQILEGVIAKQAELVCLDPYANAFNDSPSGAGHKDETEQHDHVWERKYEVDSLCAPIYLAYHYWKTTGIDSIFTGSFRQMLACILKVFRTEQDHSGSSYFFRRHDCVITDTLPCEGKGNPVAVTGMTWSGFRPSDDCCTYGYLVPANMMAVRALEYAAEILETAYNDAAAEDFLALSREIRRGIEDHAVVEHPRYGRIYAYEVDGLGNCLLMDDANSPSLLAMPYLDFCSREDALYRATRRFLLSRDNPYYFEGSLARGMGSPHTPGGFVWHIGIVMQALTSCDRQEILDCLEMLSRTHADTCFMHESFDPNAPENFTRDWFAWANTLFAELMQNLMEQDFFG